MVKFKRRSRKERKKKNSKRDTIEPNFNCGELSCQEEEQAAEERSKSC